jgi:hypothetical protein
MQSLKHHIGLIHSQTFKTLIGTAITKTIRQPLMVIYHLLLLHMVQTYGIQVISKSDILMQN